LIVNGMMTVWVNAPLFPVTVRFTVPVTVFLLVLIVSVDDPGAATELELKLAVARAGNPLTVSATVPVKPFRALTVIVVEPPAGLVIVSELGAAESEKSAGVTDVTTRVT
jgi:hypothetical protein